MRYPEGTKPATPLPCFFGVCRAPVEFAVRTCGLPCSCVVWRAPVWSAVLVCGLPCSCVVWRAPVESAVSCVVCRAPLGSAVLLWSALLLCNPPSSCGLPCSCVVCRAHAWSAVVLYGMPCSCGVCRDPVRYAVLRCVVCVLLYFSMFRRVTVQSAMLLCIQPRSCAFCVFCRAPASYAVLRYLVQNLTKRRDAQNNGFFFFV
jgi:hypothetical protein